MVILNYAVRAMVILLGVAILGGIAPFDGIPSPTHEIFGSVVVLFGIYRIISYAVARRRDEHV
jgi:hypothetical protein